MFIIHVGFRLAKVDTICTLTQHRYDPWIRIVTPNTKSRKELLKSKLEEDKDKAFESTLEGDMHVMVSENFSLFMSEIAAEVEVLEKWRRITKDDLNSRIFHYGNL